MSSELFEEYEQEFTALLAEVSKKLNGQIPNYTGEQRKAAIRNAEKELDKASDLYQDMDVEVRNAPPQYRSKYSSKMTKYSAEIQKLKRDMKATAAGTFNADRQQLLGNYEDPTESRDTRSLMVENNERLQRTSDRLANTHRIAAESGEKSIAILVLIRAEAIGGGVLAELGTQRETIVRVGQRVQSMDANLGKSKNILTSMGRRIMSSKIILFSTIILLIGILGIVLYFKLRK